LIANLVVQSMAAGNSVVVIDPKRSLVEDLLWRVPADRREEVVLLDATDSAPIGINPLVGKDPELAADAMVHLIHELYADNWGPRTQDILHASLLSLARRGDASLLHVPLLLTNTGFRRSVTARLVRSDPMGLGSFWAWYESISEAERQSVIAPVMNKLRSVLLRPGLRAILGQVEPRFDMSDIFTKRRILLVSLSKGQLGPDGAKLLGSTVVNLLWQEATLRTPGTNARPVMIFIDELQDYLRIPGDLGDALATARGYGVSFTLATQHLGAVPNHLKSALLANARSRVMFALSHEDATVMAKGSALDPEDFTSLGRYQAYASVLSRGTPTGWASLRTRSLPAASGTPTDIRKHSRQRYGRPLTELEASWADLAGQGTPRAEPLGRVQTEDGQ
jgi:type IV secretory pathway TraG/TraD family ATPase VirD4